MSNYFLSFHTIFILNENIKWLEEFIIYYKHIGFEHFYLYDNEGTIGYGSTTNKYGFEITTNSNEKDKEHLQFILNKYKGLITYTKWQPKNDKGEIEYRQPECIDQFIRKYGHESEWVAFLDLDEFIVSKSKLHLPTYLHSFDSNISCVNIVQKKFIDRFLIKGPLITQGFECIEGVKIGREWAPKNIIRCKDYLSTYNVHKIYTKNKTVQPHPDVLRFNHYNTNPKQLQWMKSFYNSKTGFTLNGIDDDMKHILHIFDSHSRLKTEL